jgi:hypothetical protein
MKTVSRRSHDMPLIFGASMLVFAILACARNTINRPNPEGQGAPTHVSGQATPISTQPGNGRQTACLAGILPGKTTRDEVVALLGEPLAVETEGDLETLLYASPLHAQFNSIVVQNQVVGLVSRLQAQDDPLAWSAVKAQYGEPAHTAYSTYLQGSLTYIYPDQGRAFVASEAQDVVFIQECFVSMALEDYMKTWGSTLPTENPFTR